ncbi:MAG: hypothetical protein LBE12_18555 [Planctomycetaceae bacterium]|jgi:regulator of replication initiation timing|nr:hypothetical protein [Planctomycetaceae bacterium]
MSNIVEKITVVEEQMALIQSKIIPLASKAEMLNQKIEKVSGLLTEITGETNMIQQEINSFQQILDSIRKLLAETKTEGEQITADQDENKYLYESMTEMFGEAFQVVSRFFETARKIGIVDKEKVTNFLALQQQIAKPETKPVTAISESTPKLTPEPTPEPISEPIISSVTEEPVIEKTLEPIVEIPNAPELQEPAITAETLNQFVETETKELPDENKIEIISAEPEPQLEPQLEPELESVSEIDEQTISPILGLPDVSVLPESFPPINNTETPINNTEPVETPIEAATLNLPPLQLTIPNNSSESGDSEPTELSEEEEKKLEDLLANISTPIST